MGKTKKPPDWMAFTPGMGKTIFDLCTGNWFDHLVNVSSTGSVVMLKFSIYKESVRCVLQEIEIPERRIYFYENDIDFV